MILVAGAVGLLCGSFANVLIARIPAREPWVTGSSHCLTCGHDLAWYDNLPLVSWVILHGRCRHCHAAIGWRYPAVEALTATLFMLIFWRFGLTALALTLAYVALISVALSAIDFAHRRLPYNLTYPTYAVVATGLTITAVIERDPWILARAGLGMLVLGGFYWVMRFASRGGMGLGDVVTAGFLGMLLAAVGWKALAVGAIVGPLIGGVAGVAAIITTRRARGVRIPYGPWLIAGAWVGLLAGPPIGRWYVDVATMSLSS